MSDYSVGPLLPVCQSTFAQSGRFKMGFFLRLWIIIAKALGIKLHPNEKPIISAVLHILTFGSAAGTKDITNIFHQIYFSPLCDQRVDLRLQCHVEAHKGGHPRWHSQRHGDVLLLWTWSLLT